MKFIKHEFFNCDASTTVHITPVFDAHVGARDCAEEVLRRTFKNIIEEEKFWISGGDTCDFIRPSDRRFSSSSLAPWIQTPDLDNLPKVQADRFLSIARPAAHLCLGMLSGNHERLIKSRDGFDIHRYIVERMAEAKNTPVERLDLGYTGVLWLSFYKNSREEKKNGTQEIVFFTHHGYSGGKAKGSKGVNMQKYSWYNRCDIALHGHSHNTDAHTDAVNVPNKRTEKVETHTIFGAFCGSFLNSIAENGVNYAEIAGYPPLPLAGIEIELRPMAFERFRRIKTSVVQRG